MREFPLELTQYNLLIIDHLCFAMEPIVLSLRDQSPVNAVLCLGEDWRICSGDEKAHDK
jgi:hypothetical protein